MRRTAQRLALGTMAVWENLRNKHPNDRSLTYCVCGDESKNASRHNAVVLCEKCPRGQSQRKDITKRTNEKQRAAAQSINQPKANERKYQISQTDTYGLEHSCF